MLPYELPLETWSPPMDGPQSIVILTGNALRHERFALRILDAFGKNVVGWYRIVPKSAAVGPTRSSVARLKNWWHLHQSAHGSIEALKRFPQAFSYALKRREILNRRASRQESEEERLFSWEVGRLKQRIQHKPVDLEKPNSAAFVDEMRKLNPWLILTLGGPLYKKRLLSTARAGVINQHAGWSPEYRGTNTTDWALYHRDLARVGSTVHLSTTGADAGPILRRSNPSLEPSDTPESVFARVVALGTELMIEVVEELLREGQVAYAKQPKQFGKTYLSRDLTDDVLIRTAEDFKDGWLREAIDKASQW